MKQLTFDALRAWNFRAALAHFAALCGFLAWFWIKLQRRFISATVVRIGAEPPTTGPPDVDPGLDYNYAFKGQFTINVPAWLLTFFALTVFAHILYATDFFGTGLYYEMVAIRGWNPARWVEYGISATCMVVILCILTGVRDITSIIPIALVTATLQGSGLIVEHQLIRPVPDRPTIVYTTVFAWLLLAAIWIPLFFSTNTVIHDARQFNPNVPTWIPLLTIVQFINFSYFGYIQLRQVQKTFAGVAPSFLQVEKQYILASLIAKLALGGFLAYGLVQRNNQA